MTPATQTTLLGLISSVPDDQTVMTFLAAAMAGTAAPLNPGYKEDEFLFYLEDTNARVLLLPPAGIDDARKASAMRKVPIHVVDAISRTATGRIQRRIVAEVFAQQAS